MLSKTTKYQNLIIAALKQYPEVIIATIVIIGLSILIGHYNLAATHDGMAHLSWQYFWNQQFWQGNFFPRWNEGSFGGLGSPSFIFYPPLARTIGFPFFMLKLPLTQQLRAVFMVFLILNAAGVILLCRLIFQHKLTQSLVILFATFNPFLIVCILKRGAIAESLAIAIMPWLMMGMYRVIVNSNKLDFLMLTIAFAALFVAHIPSSITLGCSYTLSVVILFICQKLSFQKSLIFGLIPIGAALIDAAFIFPLLFDVDLIQSVGSPPYEDKFLLFIDLLKLPFSAFYLSPEGWESSLFNSFLLGLLILVITIIVTRPWRIKNPQDILMTQQTIMVAFSIFMMTNLSLFFYQNVSIFEHIQFPWRFLTVSCSISPYLLGFSIDKIWAKNSIPIYKFITISIITMLLVLNYKSAKLYGLNFTDSSILNSLFTYQEKISSETVNRAKVEKINADYYRANVNTRRPLYITADQYIFYNDVPWSLPKKVSTDDWINVQIKGRKYRHEIPARLYPKVELIEGNGDVIIESWKSGFRQLKVDNKSAVTLIMKTFYYPGWKMEIMPSLPEVNLDAAPDGRMQLKLPAGVYSVKIWYQGTLAERFGIVVSIISLFLLALLVKLRLRKGINSGFPPSRE